MEEVVTGVAVVESEVVEVGSRTRGDPQGWDHPCHTTSTCHDDAGTDPHLATSRSVTPTSGWVGISTRLPRPTFSCDQYL